MPRHKRINMLVIVMLGVFALGVTLGSVYSGTMAETAVEELRGYITEYFESGPGNRRTIFFTSLFDNLKLFALLFAGGFINPGIILGLGINLIEGFITGFTAATLVKLLGFKGFLLGSSSIFSAIIFVAALAFYSAYSADFGLSKRKNEYGAKKEFFIFSILALAIFCIASFFDGYITTTFMGYVVNKL